MSDAGAPQLAELDRVPGYDPDAEVWLSNIAALESADPDFARRLRECHLPSNWRCVRGLCGSPTYRVEPPEADAEWLAGTAAPAIRAAAFLKDVAVTDRNPGLPGVAAGAELALLLARLAPWQAVYVFEADPRQLLAILRILPIAADIRERRCILVPPDNPEAHLLALLQREPGLLPPGNLLRLPGTPTERVETLHIVCERVAAAVGAARGRRMAELERCAAATRGTEARLAVLAPTADPRAHAAARWLADAARRLDWPVVLCAADRPAHVHTLAQSEAIAQFGPTVTIGIDCARHALPPTACAMFASWWTEARPDAGRTDAVGPGTQPGKSGAIHLAASPRIATALRAVIAPELVQNWFWGARELPSAPDPAATARVLLVAGHPVDDAAACGVEQPTHKRLWTSLRELTRDAWRQSRAASPQALLTQAEVRADVRIEPPELRAEFLRLVERAAWQAAIVDGILDTLLGDGLEVMTFGRGWTGCGRESRRLIAGPEFSFDLGANDQTPLAVIFTGDNDPLAPALLEAAARGWPVLCYGRVLDADLGGVVRATDIAAFDGPGSLRAALTGVRDPALRETRVQRLRDHVQQRHSYRARLRALLEGLPRVELHA